MEDQQLLSFQAWRRAVRDRAGGLCEGCGVPEKRRLHCCHHKDRDTKNNRLSNGEYLCRKCHGEVHARDFSEGLTGRPLSPQHRSFISEGIRSSPKARKYWESLKGKPNPAVAASNRTRVVSAETRAKISEGNRRRAKS